MQNYARRLRSDYKQLCINKHIDIQFCLYVIPGGWGSWEVVTPYRWVCLLQVKCGWHCGPCKATEQAKQPSKPISESYITLPTWIYAQYLRLLLHVCAWPSDFKSSLVNPTREPVVPDLHSTYGWTNMLLYVLQALLKNPFRIPKR